MSADPFDAWHRALQQRHTGELTFAEIRHGLQALSSLYVERRERLGSRAAFEGAGKRAAYALFYGPLHFLLMREVIRGLQASPPPDRIVDLGCGTGAAGAAWALAAGAPGPRLIGIDRSSWALEETRWTYGALGLRGVARRGDLQGARLPERGGGVVLAFTVNELPLAARSPILSRLLGAARRGAAVLVVEPIARRPVPWWGEWAEAVGGAGGRADEWRFPAALPDEIRQLDRAAGLDHSTLTGRSLFLAAKA